MSSTASDTTTTPAPPAPPPKKRASWQSTVLKLAFSITLLVILFELACQALLWKMSRGWQALKREPGHYFQPSANPVLTYELKKNYDHTTDGRSVHINQHGIRDDEETVPAAPRKIAILGDSVTFGIGQTQAETLPGVLQQTLDPTRQRVRVLNFGVPGYGLREMVELLKEKNAVYRATEVLYLLNPNDFSWRDTVYEGADNGLYRLYRRPVLASPLMVRKVIYRYQKSQSIPIKSDVLVSVPWYKWMYNGNRERGFGALRQMKKYADENQIRFTVMFLPAGCAYQDGKYALYAMYDEVEAFLKRESIASIESRPVFASDTKKHIDGTDHLTVDGNRVAAAHLAPRLAAE